MTQNRVRIGLDARTVFALNPRGIGKSLIDLYGHIAKLRPEWDVILFHEEEQNEIPTPGFLNESNIKRLGFKMRGHRFNAWEQVALPYHAWRNHIDILHCPANTCPAWMPNKTIVTIHDLIPLDGEDKFSSSEVKYFKKCVERACCKATLLFTPSNYVRKRLIDEFKADPERVFVNYWAPDSKIKKLEEDEYRTTTEKYDLQRPYCLHFGARAPRKNTETTLIAWSQLDPVKRSAWNLLVVGLDGETLQKLKKMSQDLGIESEVRLHGFVPEVHISPLMSGADVLIFASLSEGFGLPILDAWATDTAVLTGDKTSLPEIAGNAALIVDPRMPESIATGMDKLMNDSLLRHRLCALGRERLSEFTWEKSAARFIDAIEESKGLKL